MMLSRILRRLFWAVVILVVAAVVLYIALQHVQQITQAGWSRGYQALTHAQTVLQEYSTGLHVLVHGLFYLYLFWRWPSVIAWVDRRRAERDSPPMSVLEQRRMAVQVVVIIVLFEALLLLRHLG